MLNLLANLKDFVWLYCLIVVAIVIFCYNLKLDEVKSERDAALNQVAELTASVKLQNIAVEQWKAEAESAEKTQREKEQIAAKNMEVAKKDALTILNATVPQDCNDAIRWGIHEAIKARPA